MGEIVLVSLCSEAIVALMTIFSGHSVDKIFYVTTFAQFFAVTWLTLFGLNKVRIGTGFVRTLFCLIEMYCLLLMTYVIIKGAINKLDWAVLNPSWESVKKNQFSVFVGQAMSFANCVGWGLTDINNPFNVKKNNG